MTNTTRGLIIVLSGPAGAGKSTFARRLVTHREDCVLSVSATTRPPRPNETHGVDYFFLSRENFENGMARDEFVEHAEFSGNLYGTPRSFLDDNVAAGRHVILDIEVKGAGQIRRHYPDAVKIFLLPPSPETLVRRLLDRKTESREEVERRMRIARDEIIRMEEYDYLVVNDELEIAYTRIEHILEAEMRRLRGGECERWLGGRSLDEALRVPDDA